MKNVSNRFAMCGCTHIAPSRNIPETASFFPSVIFNLKICRRLARLELDSRPSERKYKAYPEEG